MSEAIEPLAFVDNAFLGVSVGSTAMSQAINDLTFVE
jgi:hypothetical protein